MCAKTLPKVTTSTNIWCLPDELLLNLLNRLHIKDLLNLCSTHTHFRDLINTHTSVWTSVSFADVWPTQPTIKHFNRAVKHGNLEAVIKLGIAYLYNEGLSGDFDGRHISTNGDNAASMFCLVESLTHCMPAFTWLFIRPPWASVGACCKERVFLNMQVYADQHDDQSCVSTCICIARTLELQDGQDSHQQMVEYLQKAVKLGSSQAAYLLWRDKYTHRVLDRAQELNSLRELRDIAMTDCLPAQLQLCTYYVSGRYGGYTATQAASFVRDFLHRSTPTYIQHIYRNNELTHSMRYILIDWLIEVAGMKDFSTQTLHAAVSVVDRFLRFHRTTRAQLQLLGVAAMVLCSRLLGKEIITIREAAWLTDNTYQYEHVVRMMGEITAVLRGNFLVVTILDYVSVLSEAANNDHITHLLCEYICECVLLQSTLGDYKQSTVAAGCIYLARLVTGKESPWCQSLQRSTGLSKVDIAACVCDVHRKCFLEGVVTDHRNVVLQAVKYRYAQEKFCGVSELKMLSREAVLHSLDVSASFTCPTAMLAQCQPDSDLITSPSRRPHGSTMDERHADVVLSPGRQQAATPPLDISAIFVLDDSTVSGYDGASEDEGEAAMDNTATTVYDSDPDLESLWCADDDCDASCHDKSSLSNSSSSSSASSFSFGSRLASLNLTASVPSVAQGLGCHLPVSVPPVSQGLGYHLSQQEAASPAAHQQFTVHRGKASTSPQFRVRRTTMSTGAVITQSDNINITPMPGSVSFASQSAVSSTTPAIESAASSSLPSQSAASTTLVSQLASTSSMTSQSAASLCQDGCRPHANSTTGGAASPRLVLRSVNRASNTASNTKRKSPHQIGSENKQHIPS